MAEGARFVCATCRQCASDVATVDIHFLWVGYAGDADDQQRLIHDSILAGVGNRVHWTGEVSDPGRYFSEFDLFAMVSREDPFPLVCLEAALHGSQSYASRTREASQSWWKKTRALWCHILICIQWAAGSWKLVENPALNAKFGKRARDKVLERHTIEQAGP